MPVRTVTARSCHNPSWGGYDPTRSVGRHIRYWYPYRTVVAVLMDIVLSGVMYWLYTQQVLCDAKAGSCIAYLAGHREDRFVGTSPPDDTVVIVGLDNKTVKDLGVFPLPRDKYATLLQNLEKAGAAVVAFDIAFPDPRDPATDQPFADALKQSKIPVVLAYGSDDIIPGSGKYIQT